MAGNAQPDAVAYLDQGRLMVRASGAASPELVESDFVAKLQERDARDRERNGWKQGSAGWMATQQPAFGALGLGDGGPGMIDGRRAARFTAIARHARDASLYYTLQTDTLGGLFRHDREDGYETRLVHKADFHAADLHHHPTLERLVCSLAEPDGTSRVAVMQDDGRRLETVTEGDCVDQCPSWVAVDGDPDAQVIVYQSAGVARDEYGQATGFGPYRIERLDMQSGEHETLLASDEWDYLLPRVTADGALWCVRRPYSAEGYHRPRWWEQARDVVMLPVQIGATVLALFNALSGALRGKPLMSSGGPPRRGPDARGVYLYGRWVRTQKGAARDGPAPLVDKTWVLTRRAPGAGVGAVDVAAGVLHYDTAPDGRLVTTDGAAVREHAADGTAETVARGRRVSQVAWLPGGARSTV